VPGAIDTMMTTESGDRPSGNGGAHAAPDGEAPKPVERPEPLVRSGLVPSRARRLALHFITVLLGASAAAGAVGGFPAALSMALGVTLAGANLLLMQKITTGMMAPSVEDGAGRVSGSRSAGGAAVSAAATPAAAGSAGGAMWALALPFKLAALVGVAYALVSLGVAQPVPLAMGFALLPLTGVFLPRPSSVPSPGSRRR
jgi:hypothetical protein